ncbi:hypothetical protein [Gellertiella hungarica]|uniref:Uncharacterized protein n=1 Tax=Gellertiella hungarica TaxID=1572859 RepID=A0A7W6NKZ0_9HYPH|nr:hypothetical protein [Gellertiella hungarica]MBB4064792.1 hypothetical protein [Gellertiella hungarica]
MEISQLYLSSPDWIKALIVILPHATLYGLARLVLHRERSVRQSLSIPASAPLPIFTPPPVQRDFLDIDTTMSGR